MRLGYYVAEQKHSSLSPMRSQVALGGVSSVDRAVGRQLADARQRRSLTYGDLSVLSGVEELDIAAFEKGVVRPEPRALIALMAALDIKVSSLFRG